MNKSVKEIVISAAALMLIAGCVTAALAGTNALTADTIAASNERIATAARQEVIDADDFTAATLSTADGDVTYYTAVKGGKTVGYVFSVTTSGKSAGLVVMTGVSADGKITGVKVVEQNETAGYVDKVLAAGLTDNLKGRDSTDDVDAVSQATKTSNGIFKGVNKALSYYEQIKGVTA